ncbi:MAG: hypothetical protein IPG50_30420 [Myxococcales bacterium]|nr:hypothetical protein [Myxococcales bacterium]
MMPYRDELEALRAEVARLNAALARRRTGHGRLTLILLVLELGALFAFQPWLNATNDAKFWAGVLVIVGLFLLALASAYRTRSAD